MILNVKTSAAATTANVVVTTSGNPVDSGAMSLVGGTTYQYTFSFTESPGLTYVITYSFVISGQSSSWQETVVSASASPTSTMTVTYDVLRREIGRFLGYGRDPSTWDVTSDQFIDVSDILLSGLRRVLTPPPIPGERYSHEWSFVRPTVQFNTTAPVSTGTVTVVSGVVTLAGSTWPSWAAQGSLVIFNGTYLVSTKDSPTQITLTDTTVTAPASTAYTLSQTTYDLPVDFAAMDGPLVYATGQSVLRQTVAFTSQQQVLMNLAFEVTPSYPRQFCVRIKPIDQSAATRYEMVFCPSPDASYAMFYKYRVAIPALDGLTNVVPPGGDAHGELYLEACLSAAEQKLHDTQGIHSARFMECLIASVSMDRKANCPDTLGTNFDWSDRPMFDPENHLYTMPPLTRYGAYPA